MRDGVFLSFLRMCCEPVCLPSNFTHCEVYPVQIWAECVLYFENMVNKHGEQGTDHSNLAFTLSGRQIYCSNFPRREFEHFLCFYYNFFWENTRRLDERGFKCKRDFHSLTFSAFIILLFMICSFRSVKIKFINVGIWLHTLRLKPG